MATFSSSAHWRDSARNPRFFLIDARGAFAVLLFLIHISKWTGVVVIINTVFFAILERFGFTVPVFFRWLRVFLAGPIRIAKPWWY